ncbi:MAG: phosphosulfolactate synthase [Actinomycetota bacterium]|jgi:phosphosulfolactate synthase|nr:phosphosulfolactate synthase [Actinomycetota bacterium]
MVNVMPDFLTLPERAAKPRRRGITHVLDKGMPLGEVEALLQVCGGYVDVWKLGWGTAYLDHRVADKLALLDRNGILACTGGTLLEVAWRQGVTDEFLDWAAASGFPCVEVSCGVVAMSVAQKRSLIAAAAQRFIVLGEIGAKDPRVQIPAATWGEAAAADLEAGATWVVTEGRESGTVGLFDPSGQVRVDVVDAVVDAIGVESTVFEAPLKDQQAWLIRRFGPDVNIGNVLPGEALGLEALRLGLRADTLAASEIQQSPR